MKGWQLCRSDVVCRGTLTDICVFLQAQQCRQISIKLDTDRSDVISRDTDRCVFCRYNSVDITVVVATDRSDVVSRDTDRCVFCRYNSVDINVVVATDRSDVVSRGTDWCVFCRYNSVDINVAVATDNGLITPIVFSADTKVTWCHLSVSDRHTLQHAHKQDYHCGSPHSV